MDMFILHPLKKVFIQFHGGLLDLKMKSSILSSKVYTLTPQDLSNATDPYVLFGFNFDSISDIQTIKIDLVGPDKSIVQSNSILIHNKNGLRIPLNPFLFEVQNTTM